MKKQIIFPAVLLAALGYFVDIYDLILFSIVRVKSLKAIGVPDAAVVLAFKTHGRSERLPARWLNRIDQC